LLALLLAALAPRLLGAQDAPPDAVPAGKQLHFDGELRFRYELQDPARYTDGETSLSDDFVFMRTRVGMDFELHPRVATYVQIQDSRIWGEEGDPVFRSEDTFDLRQGYVDLRKILAELLGDHELTFRLGRQELSYGDQRLVSPLDWSNITRSWDAARIIFTGANGLRGLRADAFASIIKDTTAAKNGFPESTPGIDSKQEFHGLYLTYDFGPLGARGEESKAIVDKLVADLYTFYRVIGDDSIVNEDGREGRAREATMGARAAAGAAGFDLTAEAVYQAGRWADDTINAWAAAIAGGYTIPPELLREVKLRVGVEYDFASGDSDPDDGDKESFDPLFPFGHYYQGMQDIFSWKNGHDLVFKAASTFPKSECFGVELNPIWIEVQYHFFWLAEDRDGWFNAAKAQIRRDVTGDSGRFVGSEIDVQLKYTTIDLGKGHRGPQRLWTWFGYSHFFPGEFVRDTGESPHRDFAYASMELEF
jgi:hypothetical protein